MKPVVDFRGTRIAPSSLVELLHLRATYQPDQLVYTFLEDGENETAHLTYAQLDQQAQSIAGRLKLLEADGKRALLLYPPGPDYIAGFFGCLYAGVTAVPAYPPDPTRLDRTLPRLQAICADAQATFVLTTSPILALAEMLAESAATLQALTWLATDVEPDARQTAWQAPAVSGDTLAFLQYTSGSTGTPKGVMLSHANLLHNSALISQAFSITPEDVAVIWLPPYHDMGLIGGIIQPIYAGLHCMLMPPTAFLQRPFNWLKAVARYKATISGGPNFAYDLCVRKTSSQQRAALDLSRWRVAFNGAEPVRHETLARFSQTFAPSGFNPSAFEPCYGLAEATLVVSSDTRGSSPLSTTVKKAALLKHQVETAKPDEGDTKTVVSCGQTLGNQEIIIVQPDSFTRLAPKQIGEIWLAGESVAQGYWNRPEETAQTFQARLATGEGPYLRTGDLGFWQDGELFIAGRVKDLIIIRGRNHYPQDIELTVEKSHPALRAGCTAAFSVEVENEERLVVVQEVYTTKHHNPDEVIQAIRQAVAQEHELQLYAVALIQPRTIPKTSSGKIQRRACRRQYLEGSLPIVKADVLEKAITQTTVRLPAANSLVAKALLALPETERQPLLTAHLQVMVAEAIGQLPERLDPERPLPSLGLDSATAAELTHEIEAATGVQLRLETLLQETSIADLAAQLLAKLARSEEVETAVFSAEPQPASPSDATTHPLSPGQRALWFLHQLYPQSPAYNVVHAARILTDLDINAFRRVFQHLVDRHPSLRTTFSAPQGEPVQTIHPRQTVFFQVEDATEWTGAQVESQIAAEVYRPFNLENGPLMRVTLFKQSSQEYILILALHHIITDLWSSAVLMSEIGQLYQAECSGMPARLKPLRSTYVEHVRRQKEMLSGAEGEKLRQFWLEQLHGDLPSLNLPTDRPPKAVPSHRGAIESIQLSPQLSARLQALATAHQATPFMTSLTAFQVLLHRYTGQDDILIGTTRANRTQKDARLVGYFVNPLVIRANLAQNPTFSQLLDQTRQTTLAAFAHGDYPFPLLVEQVQPDRDAGQTPLFQVMFSWQKTTRLVASQDVSALALNESQRRLMLGILPLESMSLAQWVSPFDLTLLMAEIGEGPEARFLASFEYSTDLFNQATIQRMLRHFETLLAGIVAHPQQKLSELPLMTQEEQGQLLEWNRSIQPRQTPFVTQQIEQRVKETPGALALKLGKTQLTYDQLNQRANQMAHYLQRLGIGPNVNVGVCTERSIAAILAMLAVLKAGGTYLPIDPAVPQERLAFILADANVQILLTQASLMPRLHAFTVPAFCLDVDWPSVEQESAENLSGSIGSRDVAYMIYTSGSTGKPKGVLISHGAIADHIQTVRDHFGLTAVDRVLQFASYSFDQSIEQILATLAAGATLALRGPDIWPPEKFPQFVADEELTVINLPPAYWEQVVQAWIQVPEPATHLRLVIIGGDVVQPATVSQWRRLPLQNARLLNAYGPTETTITATTFEIPAQGELPNPIPIGRPLPNRSAFILDKYGNPVPVGVPGELHIGGPCLANGYYNRLELTAERFVKLSGNVNPSLASRLSTIFYRTGDLCRYRPDGQIEFLGRVDHQVKVRGFRIELGEIEAVLNQYPDVRQTAVLLHEAGSSKKLVAYLAVPAAHKPTDSELKQYLRRLLPDYMVPSFIVTMDTLPMTLSGKIDRSSLRAIDQLPAAESRRFVAPRTPIEAELAQMWASLLETDQVGVFDNFFDLGGHSLLITKLASRLRDRFEVNMPLRDLFEAATVADLSLLLAQHQAATAEEAEVAALLTELEQLSDEDAHTLLKEV